MNRKNLRLILALPLAALLLWPLYSSADKSDKDAADGVSLDLHGSTPSMAWSPDGTRLVINSGYEYFGFDEEVKKHRNALGIYVLDATTGKHEQIYRDQGYHPLWLDNETLAWGHSPYEDGTQGLFIARMGGPEPGIDIHEREIGVYHTQPLKDGGILFYNGWSGSQGWMRFDPVEKLSTPMTSVTQPSSWDRALEHTLDQCPTTAGGITVSVNEKGSLTLTRDDKTVATKHKLFAFRMYGGGYCDAPSPEHCQPVSPCLSPDGKRVAFVVPAAEGYRARILETETLLKKAKKQSQDK